MTRRPEPRMSIPVGLSLLLTLACAGDPAADAAFGCAVAIEGPRAIVGARNDAERGESAGAAYVFRRQGAGWIQTQKLTPQDASPYGVFGVQIAIEGDTAMIAAWDDNDNGLLTLRTWPGQASGGPTRVRDVRTYDAKDRLETEAGADDAERAHRSMVRAEIQGYLTDREWRASERWRPLPPPPGSPIGSAGCSHDTH